MLGLQNSVQCPPRHSNRALASSSQALCMTGHAALLQAALLSRCSLTEAKPRRNTPVLAHGNEPAILALRPCSSEKEGNDSLLAKNRNPWEWWGEKLKLKKKKWHDFLKCADSHILSHMLRSWMIVKKKLFLWNLHTAGNLTSGKDWQKKIKLILFNLLQ